MYISTYKAQLIANLCYSSLQRKVLSHYDEGEAPVEFVSTVEEHYRQIFISAETLL